MLPNALTRQATSELLCQFGGLLFAGIDHIDRTAIPRMFERKRHDFPDTDESQPEFDIPAQILEPGLRNRLKSSLVAFLIMATLVESILSEPNVITDDHARSDRKLLRRDIQLFEFNPAFPHFA